MKRLLYIYIGILFLLFGATRVGYAQSNKVYHPMIHTLQTIVNDDWLHDDVITLGTDDWVTISFDHFTHDYHRFTYRIVHCNADWTPSDLFEVDYMDGFNDQPIEDYENSLNTTMLYTHYRLDLPNDNIQFKASGNYRVEIYLEEEDAAELQAVGHWPLAVGSRDNDDEEDAAELQVKGKGLKVNGQEPRAKSQEPRATQPLVAVACFRIVEPRMGLNVAVTSNTDIDTNLSHQQVEFTLNYPPSEVMDPATEIKSYVYQNNRTDNAVALVKPTYVSPGHSEYTHNRALIFPAGNEYRRFEVINMHYATQGVDKVEYFAPYYHATLLPDAPRRNYSFDVDHDGRYLIRYNLAEDADIEADYLFVHFTLDMPRRTGGNFYLTGEFTYNDFTPAYQATYNEDSQAYEATVLLKQGAYDFMYLWVPDGSGVGQTGPAEGNFYEAENEYQVYIYHRPFGGRYDRLVAAQQVKFAQE
ncbi:MAG: DUF5103 domain-containing protein [Bacteroidaceae bacterium]|nr:DUF5103 domain-containing protein [Bacteroidaceae bacterium]